MGKINSTSVSVAINTESKTLTKLQKSFNALIKQIEKRRKRLADWESVRPVFQQRYVDEFIPAEQEMAELQIRMACQLDKAHGHKALTKAERRKLAEVIINLAGRHADDNESMKAIYNKYNVSDYDSEVEAEFSEFKFMLEAMTGIDLGDDINLRDPEATMKHIMQQFEQQTTEEAEHPAVKSQRKKSAKQRAAEARAQEEKSQISLSIREVYRKLASALHPDREGDPQERERKTQLMQRVNNAYQANNLLQLLELQLELEHIDQGMIDNLSEDRLLSYNKILKDQVRELDQEILHVEENFKFSYGFEPFAKLAPSKVLKDLAADIKQLQFVICSLRHDLSAFEDIKQLKTGLRQIPV